MLCRRAAGAAPGRLSGLPCTIFPRTSPAVSPPVSPEVSPRKADFFFSPRSSTSTRTFALNDRTSPGWSFQPGRGVQPALSTIPYRHVGNKLSALSAADRRGARARFVRRDKVRPPSFLPRSLGQPERLAPLAFGKGQPAPALTGGQWTCIYIAACSAAGLCVGSASLLAPRNTTVRVWVLGCIFFLPVF